MSEFVSRKTAGALVEAIARWPDWVYGRADRVRLRSGEHGVLAHQIDCLPIPDPQLAFDPGERTERVIGGVRGQIMVPLVFMRKSPRYRVNAATASEHPIPLLTTYETESLLHEMVMQILENSEIPPTPALRDAMQTILGPSGSDHEAHVEKLCATGVWHETRLWAASRRLPSTLVLLMRTLASNTLVIGLIPAGDTGVRQILTLRYSWRVPSPSLMERLRAGLVSTGISHLELRVPLHMSSATRSHILEFRAPWQLTVERILITGDADDFSRRNRGSVESTGRVDAQYPSAPGSYARVHLRVPLRGLRATALLSSGVTLCVAAVCIAMGFERAPLSEPGVTGLLLTPAAAMIGFLALRQEPGFVSRVLVVLRAVVICCALGLFGLAVVVAGGATIVTLSAPAIALAICAGLVFCMLLTAPLIYRVKKRKYSGLSV